MQQRSAPKASMVSFYANTERFVYDGSRVPNPMNGERHLSKNGREASSQYIGRHYLDWDDSEYSLSLEGKDGKDNGDKRFATAPSYGSGRGWSPMMSTRSKTATNLSYVAGDTRFDTLQAPYAEPLGPGQYNIEISSPSIGPLPLDSSLRGAMPAKDPWRPHQAFLATERPSIFKFNEGHYLGSYVHPDSQGIGATNAAALQWSRSSDARPDVSDYRYATRHRESDKQVPEAGPHDSVQIDTCGKQVELGAAHANASVVPFQSEQPRLALLPRARLNDTRLGTQRRDDDPAAGGPGAYSPLISIGGAKRKTYRLYSQDAGSCPSSGRTGASMNFSSISRAHKFGASSPARDSALRR